MRLPTLIFALFVLGARAATIVGKKEIDIEKKIQDVVKDEKVPTENVSSEQELLDQANVIKELDNNLRKGVQIVDIPVKVVVEDVKPSLKKEVIPNEAEPTSEIDLKNPGEPQHQEHETQNPIHYDEKPQTISAIIRQNIEQTQNVFNNNFEQFQQNVQNWWNTNQQIIQLQQQMQALQQNFQSQIEKLNQTAQKYWPDVTNPAPLAIGLQNLENNVNAGVKSLTESVEAIVSGKDTIKEDGKQEESSSSIPPFGQGPFASYFQQMQQQIQQGFQNVTNQFQTYFNNSQNAFSGNNNGSTNIFQNWGQGVQNFLNQQGSNGSAGAQADEGVGSGSRPTIWQSITSIFNPQNPQNPSQPAQEGQQADTPVNQPSTPNRPIVQAIQNNPLYQTVASVFQPNKPAGNKPAEQKPDADKPVSGDGANVVPAKPESDQKVKPETIQYAQSGPIKQMLIEKNPIVQGIAGAMQRIQQSITGEKPREVVKDCDQKDEKNEDEKKDEEKDDDKKQNVKFGFGYGGYHGGYGGHGGSGDNNGVAGDNLKVKSEPAQEQVQPSKKPEDSGKPSEGTSPAAKTE